MQPTPRTMPAPFSRPRDASAPEVPVQDKTNARFEVGFASEHEERRVLAWLNAGLRPHRPGRLQREYPFLFDTASPALPITTYIDHRPVAFCMLWPAPFRLDQGILRMGLISLVYTDPAHRGRGYASQTLEQAIKEARARSLGCLALWSDLDDLYSSLGFLPAGCETLLALTPEIVERAAQAQPPSNTTEAPDSLTISAPVDSDWLAIERIRAERACAQSLPLSPAQMAGIPDMEVRVARRGEQTIAFAIRGRGDDFAGVLHEWGGEATGVILCCEALALPDPLVGSLQLLSSKGRTDVTWRLRAAGASVHSRPLAWFKLADHTAFAADLAQCLGLKTAWRIAEMPAQPAAAPSLCVGPAGAERIIPLQHFLDACFGASCDAAESAALESIHPLLDLEETQGEGGLPLPLPFFISGLESI